VTGRAGAARDERDRAVAPERIWYPVKPAAPSRASAAAPAAASRIGREARPGSRLTGLLCARGKAMRAAMTPHTTVTYRGKAKLANRQREMVSSVIALPAPLAAYVPMLSDSGRAHAFLIVGTAASASAVMASAMATSPRRVTAHPTSAATATAPHARSSRVGAQ